VIPCITEVGGISLPAKPAVIIESYVAPDPPLALESLPSELWERVNRAREI
jgi:hypothetical protein